MIRNKQKPITCSLPHPPAPPHHPPKCKNFSRWRRYPAAINSRKYEKRKEQHQQNRGMKFYREGENEKWHNKAILLKSHLTVNKSNDLMRTSRRRARGGTGGGSTAFYFYAPTLLRSVCARACVCRGHSIKNNCCLSHLWLNEIWWLLLLLMWPRLRYYLLLEVMAGLDKTHVSLQGVDFLICCRISELPSVSLPLHMLHTERRATGHTFTFQAQTRRLWTSWGREEGEALNPKHRYSWLYRLPLA